jgi:hypothetical protein
MKFIRSRASNEEYVEYVLPRTGVFLGLCDNSQIGDVRYGRQSLPTKTISGEMRQVRKLGEFRGRETVSENGKICFLCRFVLIQRPHLYRDKLAFIPQPLSCI